MALSESQARLTASEPARWIVVYKNGNEHFPGRRMVVKPREVRTFEHLLEEVTLKLEPSFGAVRNIFTPEGGTRVASLTDIRPNGHYVASPNEPFRQLSRTRYMDIPAQPATHSHISPQTSTGKEPPTPSHRLRAVPARYLDTSGDDIIIHVFRNGDAYGSSKAFQLSRVARVYWDQTLERIGDKLEVERGVYKLYSIHGQLIRDPTRELENGGSYVAAADIENFKLLNYGATMQPFRNVARQDSFSRRAPSPPARARPRPPVPLARSLTVPRLAEHQRSRSQLDLRPVPAARGRTPLLPPPPPPLCASFPQLAERAQRLRDTSTARQRPWQDPDDERTAPPARKRRPVRRNVQYTASSPVTAAYSVDPSTSASDRGAESIPSTPDLYYGGPQSVYPAQMRQPFFLQPTHDATTQIPSDTGSQRDPNVLPMQTCSFETFLGTVPTVEDVDFETTMSTSGAWTSPPPMAASGHVDLAQHWLENHPPPVTSYSAPIFQYQESLVREQSVEYIEVIPPWYHDYQPLRSSQSAPSVTERSTPELTEPIRAPPAHQSAMTFLSVGYSPLPEPAQSAETPSIPEPEIRHGFYRVAYVDDSIYYTRSCTDFSERPDSPQTPSDVESYMRFSGLRVYRYYAGDFQSRPGSTASDFSTDILRASHSQLGLEASEPIGLLPPPAAGTSDSLVRLSPMPSRLLDAGSLTASSAAEQQGSLAQLSPMPSGLLDSDSLEAKSADHSLAQLSPTPSRLLDSDSLGGKSADHSLAQLSPMPSRLLDSDSLGGKSADHSLAQLSPMPSGLLDSDSLGGKSADHSLAQLSPMPSGLLDSDSLGGKSADHSLAQLSPMPSRLLDSDSLGGKSADHSLAQLSPMPSGLLDSDSLGGKSADHSLAQLSPMPSGLLDSDSLGGKSADHSLAQLSPMPSGLLDSDSLGGKSADHSLAQLSPMPSGLLDSESLGGKSADHSLAQLSPMPSGLLDSDSLPNASAENSLVQLSPMPSGMLNSASSVKTPVTNPVTQLKKKPSTAPKPAPRPSVLAQSNQQRRALTTLPQHGPAALPPPEPASSDADPPRRAGWDWDEMPIRPAEEAGWYGRVPWVPPESDAAASSPPQPRPVWQSHRPLAPPTDLGDRPVWPPSPSSSPSEGAPASPASEPPTESSTVPPPDINQKLDDIANLLRTLLLQNLLSSQGTTVSSQLTEQQVQALVQAMPQQAAVVASGLPQQGTGDGDQAAPAAPPRG